MGDNYPEGSLRGESAMQKVPELTAERTCSLAPSSRLPSPVIHVVVAGLLAPFRTHLARASCVSS